MEDSYVLQLTDRKFADLYLCFCGYAKCEPLHSFGPAVRPNYILHYILEGKGRYYVGDEQYDLEDGQGFLIEPEVQTFYQADQEHPWSYVWIGFSGSRAKEYLKDIGLGNGQRIFYCSRAVELKLTVVNMLKNDTYSLENQFLLQSLLYSFFAIIAKGIEIPASSDREEDNLYIRRAVEYIQNNYSNGVKVADIAEHICINRSYLYTLFRKCLNVSPQDYLTNYRISRAKELLTLTDLPVGGVAISCGYQDAMTFAKVFKGKVGMTPSQYRKKDRKDAKDHLKQNKEKLEGL